MAAMSPQIAQINADFRHGLHGWTRVFNHKEHKGHKDE
jgi:hypothetical protein